jgi:DNA gyrase subunit B
MSEIAWFEVIFDDISASGCVARRAQKVTNRGRENCCEGAVMADAARRIVPRYEAEDVGIKEGLAGVRHAPSMYIGSQDERGLHQLAWEILNNSVDEGLAGVCRNVWVELHADGSLSVADDGRGIPVAEHPQRPGVSALEVVMCILHAGSKFGGGGYEVSGGLHGLGASCVNALSEWTRVEVCRDGKVYAMEFSRGQVTQRLKVIGRRVRTGTRTRFFPDAQIFGAAKFNFETIVARCRELAYLNEEITIHVAGESTGEKHEFHFARGVPDFVRFLNQAKDVLHSRPIHIAHQDGPMRCDIAIQYNDSFSENVLCFANGISNAEGGTHLSGFRTALTRTLNAYAKNGGIVKEEALPSGDDWREGLAAIVSVRLPAPRFESQVKVRLLSEEAESFVAQAVSAAFSNWLEEHPTEARRIAAKAIAARQTREAIRKTRELSRKSVMSSGGLPGKLWDCSSRDAETTELYIVEGQSAGGTAKGGRDRVFQAILPIKGKILNVEKARVDKMLDNIEIGTIIQALACGIGAMDFDAAKLRYGKIIIMTDADVDGSHIRTLLLTFFFRQMPQLIRDGRIYVAQPPLYKVTRKRQVSYLRDEAAMRKLLVDLGTQSAELVVQNRRRHKGETLRRIVSLLESVGDQANLTSRRGLPLAHVVARWDELKNRPEVRRLGELFSQLAEFDIAWREWFMRVEESVSGEKLRTRYAIETPAGVAAVAGAGEIAPAIFEIARQGMEVGRFKGLGEMNAEELWMTTMDPARRTLLRVTLESASKAEAMFSTLMGENVERRREFIEEHALDVKNLDI